MAIYKTYPNRVDYDRIARAIIQKFPFLKNPINGHVSKHNKQGTTFNMYLL